MTTSAAYKSTTSTPKSLHHAPIRFVDLHRQYEDLKDEIDGAIQSIFDSAGFILGSEVDAFEHEFASYCGVKHCVGVGSGLDALTLALKSFNLKRGDDVILPGNTFIATALAVSHAGGTPVLVDHDPSTYNMDPGCFASAITSRTKVVIPVHLYGQAADMDRIRAIACEHGISVLEDAAQAHGATFKDQRCGSLGDMAAFSFYPGKNLGGAGDGGAVVTNDDDFAAWLRQSRNYGSTTKYKHETIGYNSRLDGLQAAILRVKLRYLDQWNDRRRCIAERYQTRLAELPVVLPVNAPHGTPVHHLYVIRCHQRDAVLKWLEQNNISAGVHYPIPIHKQKAYHRRCHVPHKMVHTESYASQLLSLPMHPHMMDEDVDIIAQCLHDFPGDMSV